MTEELKDRLGATLSKANVDTNQLNGFIGDYENNKDKIQSILMEDNHYTPDEINAIHAYFKSGYETYLKDLEAKETEQQTLAPTEQKSEKVEYEIGELFRIITKMAEKSQSLTDKLNAKNEDSLLLTQAEVTDEMRSNLNSDELMIIEDYINKTKEEQISIIKAKSEDNAQKIETAQSAELEYTKEQLENVIRKVEEKYEDFKNKRKIKGNYFDQSHLPNEEELNSVLNEQEKAIIVDWANKQQTDKVKFLGQYNQPTSGYYESQKVNLAEQNQSDSQEKPLEEMTKEELIALFIKKEEQSKQQNEKIMQELAETKEQLKQAIEGTKSGKKEKPKKERKKLNVLVKNKPAFWRKIGAIALGIAIGTAVNFTPAGPAGVFITNIVGIAAKKLVNNKIKNIRLKAEEDAKNPEIKNISNPDEDTRSRAERFRDYFKSEEFMKDINTTITTAMVTANVVGIGNAAINGFQGSADAALSEGFGGTGAEETIVTEGSNLGAGAETATTTTPEIADITVGTDVNGTQIGEIYDNQMLAAEQMSAETPAQWVSPQYGSEYTQLTATMPDGTVVSGDSLADLVANNPDAVNFTGEIQASHGHQGWDNLNVEADAIREGMSR